MNAFNHQAFDSSWAGRKIARLVLSAAILLVVWGLLSPTVNAASPESPIRPVRLLEYPDFEADIVQLVVEVPWSGPDPSEAAILLQLPERQWTHIDFVEFVRNDDRVGALYELDQLGELWTGLQFHYRWRFTDVDGVRHVTEDRTVLTIDPNRGWRLNNDPIARVFDYSDDSEFGPQILATALEAIELIDGELGFTVKNQVRVVTYSTSADLLEVLGAAADDGTKGLWFASHELIMLYSDPEDETLNGVLTHELTHAAIGQYTNAPWRLPTWVHEGLATRMQAKVSGGDDYDQTVAEALSADELISLRGLRGYLPIERGEVSLVYAESYSLMSFLIDTYGVESVTALLTAFASGQTEDESLVSAIGIDAAALEADWLANLEESAAANAAAPAPARQAAGTAAQPAAPPDGAEPQTGEPAAPPDVELAETLVGNDELPLADDGTRAFIAISGLTVIGLLALTALLARRRGRPSSALAASPVAPPPFALMSAGRPGDDTGAPRWQSRSAISASNVAGGAISSDLARSARRRVGGFGFNRSAKLAPQQLNRFLPFPKPKLRRFRARD